MSRRQCRPPDVSTSTEGELWSLPLLKWCCTGALTTVIDTKTTQYRLQLGKHDAYTQQQDGKNEEWYLARAGHVSY
jgi:hypothetical protein